MRRIYDYECKHCGAGEGKHAAFDKWCPSPNNCDSDHVSHSSTKYLCDKDKPIYRETK